MTRPRPAAFAVPGDLDTLTGGYIYERRLLDGLRAEGRSVEHIALPGSFPDPTEADTATTAARLAAVDPGTALILDGFLSGALDPGAVARIRAPFVAMVHHPLALESGLSGDRARHLHGTERANLAMAAHVLVPSPHTRGILIDRYDVPAAKITVARPGVDRPGGTPDPADPPMILSVGILHPRKGHDVLLRALARLTDLRWTATIVGADWHPAHAAEVRALAADPALKGRVTLAGRVGTKALHRHYRRATVFALATRYEGYGIVFDEALAAGLPIVSCATGAVPDTVPPDAGLLVPPDDPDAFADALRSLLTDGTERAARTAAARRHGARLPTWAGTAAIASGVLDALP